MQTVDDLLFTPASRLVGALARRDLSPVDLVDASLRRIEEIDPRIGAFVTVLADEARAAARASADRLARGEGRALEGVPIPIKEEIPVAGAPMRMGSRAAPDIPSPMDAEVVARLRRAGAIVIGTTAMPEFGTIPTTEHPDGRATRNPWDPTRTPGGSSGGAAAAVAAGMACAAHGRDGGGSLRIPAASCGLFTVKPTRGRISLAPLVGETPLGLVTDGFITRTVADCALLLDVVSGYATGDPYWAPAPARPFAAEVTGDCPPLRIGVTTAPPIDVPVDPVCLDATRDLADLLTTLGHHVEEHALPWRDDTLLGAFLQVWATSIGLVVELLGDLGGDRDQVEPHNRLLWEQGKALAAVDYAKTAWQLHGLARRLVASWETYDVVLTPALATLPPPLGDAFSDYASDPMSIMTKAALFTPFTGPVNVTGQPAAALPVGWHDGLPVACQLIGRPADEATLLRLSAQIEAARPWADRRPGV